MIERGPVADRAGAPRRVLGSASPARSAGSSSRTPAGCATRSGWRCRSGWPRRTSSRWRTRSATWSPGTPGPTARSPRARARPGSGSACSWSSRRSSGWPRPAGSSPASSRRRRRPAARRSAPSGATPRCCGCCAGGRSPRCAGRSSRCRRPRWPPSCPAGSRSARRPRASRRVAAAVEQLQGAAIPASAWERLVLPARVADYSPAYLDELCACGEVVWAGSGAIPGGDGWVTLACAGVRAAAAAAARPDVRRAARCTSAVLAALAGGRRCSSGSSPTRSRASPTTPSWLAGALGPGLGRAGRQRHARPAAGAARRRRARTGPGRPRPRVPLPARPGCRRAGCPAPRWPPPGPARRPWPAAGTGCPSGTQPDPAGRRARRRAAGAARRGHPGRGDGRADAPGGFAAVYPVLAALEERGAARRGYFVEGLGAAQFAVPGAVDRLRALAEADGGRGPARPGRRRPSCSPPPTRPTRTARRCPGRSGWSTEGRARHAGTGPGARPARWW